ncbi:MAG TPA: DUF87 domain-containing protein, partial [Candidatus Dormibacteraeota bacterium]|nr:DUF87 domain-containing protein [Candidatus Dormibacteraeota bacterium]
MPARIPLDIDLEDKLLYGLTPTRLVYLVVALLAAFATWTAQFSIAPLRGGLATAVASIGAAMAWGRWRGRAADSWLADIAIFALANYRVRRGPAALITIARREPMACWRAAPDLVVTRTENLGFAGAAAEDRTRWLNAFRRMLDSLDSPLQVVIEVQTGGDDDRLRVTRMPSGFEYMRGADLAFAQDIRRSASSHYFTTSLVTTQQSVQRLHSALTEMGIRFCVDQKQDAVFGQETPSNLLHSRGFGRAWYVDRLPGTELDPGWLFRLLPPGLDLTLAYHVMPLPADWIVSYLQRQLINMRATRLLDADAGTKDPTIDGALPNAEDLQRRLTASQDKAFHVSVYIALTASTSNALVEGSRRLEAAARAVLCELQPCTFRMLDGFLATRPGAPDRLQRKRVLDSTALVTFFPWHEPDLQQPGGIFVGCNRGTGAPVLVDPFDQRRYANANVAVFGHSGAGKTYLLSALALGALGRGTQVFIVDPEHEYCGLAGELGGVDVQLALGSGHALNVLELRPADRRDESWIGPAAADAVDLCA